VNATFALLAQLSLDFGSILFWGLLTGAIGLGLRLAPRIVWRKLGTLVGLVGVALIGVALSLSPLDDVVAQVLFYLMAAIAVIASAATITSRSPVYAAIWFAISLLGTAGLFLLQGAHFLGIATIVVYAGAIVVTFLFVLMLAQPEGHASYDRISWAGFATPLALIAGALLVGVITSSLPDFSGSTLTLEQREAGVLHEAHVAKLGSELFARHLVSVEVGGTILLVALVGAIVIVIQGKPRMRSEEGGAAS
jgi:NADH-quinone oxidoreductase subunit J